MASVISSKSKGSRQIKTDSCIKGEITKYINKLSLLNDLEIEDTIRNLALLTKELIEDQQRISEVKSRIFGSFNSEESERERFISALEELERKFQLEKSIEMIRAKDRAQDRAALMQKLKEAETQEQFHRAQIAARAQERQRLLREKDQIRFQLSTSSQLRSARKLQLEATRSQFTHKGMLPTAVSPLLLQHRAALSALWAALARLDPHGAACLAAHAPSPNHITAEPELSTNPPLCDCPDPPCSPPSASCPVDTPVPTQPCPRKPQHRATPPGGGALRTAYRAAAAAAAQTRQLHTAVVQEQRELSQLHGRLRRLRGRALALRRSLKRLQLRANHNLPDELQVALREVNSFENSTFSMLHDVLNEIRRLEAEAAAEISQKTALRVGAVEAIENLAQKLQSQASEVLRLKDPRTFSLLSDILQHSLESHERVLMTAADKLSLNV